MKTVDAKFQNLSTSTWFVENKNIDHKFKLSNSKNL